MRAICVLPDDGADCQSGVALTPSVRVLAVSAVRVCRCGSPVRAIGHATIAIQAATINVEIAPDGMRLPDGVVFPPATLRLLAAETERAWAEGLLAQWARRRGGA